MKIDTNLINEAWYFASKQHRGQLYPGKDKLPYLTHIGSVVIELLPALQENDIPDATLAICCAILHDTVEDTSADETEIAIMFGKAIAAGVSSLSKNKTLHGMEATLDSLKRIQQQSREVWMVKLADRVANLRIPPSCWSTEKCHAYAEEAQAILDTLGEASTLLASTLKTRIVAWKNISKSCNAIPS